MKLDEFVIKGVPREMRSFVDQVTLLLNFGKYSSQVLVDNTPTWPARNGEFLFFTSGTIQRLYFYINDTWQFLEYVTGNSGQVVGVGVAGNDTEIQFNSGGTFGAKSTFAFDYEGDRVLVSGAFDGAYEALRLRNALANSVGSVDETAQINFGFGTDTDVARLTVGKLADYTNSANASSFITLKTDSSGTLYEAIRFQRRNIMIGTDGLIFPDAQINIKGLFTGSANERILAILEGANNRHLLSLHEDGLFMIGDTAGSGTLTGEIQVGGTDVATVRLVGGTADRSAVLSFDWFDAVGSARNQIATFNLANPATQSTKKSYILFDRANESDVSSEVKSIEFNEASDDHTLSLAGNYVNQRFFGFSRSTVNGNVVANISNAATVFIEGDTVTAQSATIKNNYALYVSQGLVRFQGDGTYVLEVPSNNTVIGAGTSDGVIPVVIAGTLCYIPYYIA